MQHDSELQGDMNYVHFVSLSTKQSIRNWVNFDEWWNYPCTLHMEILGVIALVMDLEPQKTTE